MSRTRDNINNIEINEALDLVGQIGTNMINSFVTVARPIVSELNNININSKNKEQKETLFKPFYEFIDDKYIVFIPGVKKEDINVKVKDKKLTIRTKTSIGSSSDKNFINYTEKNYNLEIQLKEKIPQNNFNLKFYNGVLIISDKEEEQNLEIS